MFNKVILVGNLTRDIELKYLTNGSCVGNFGLATNRKWKDTQSGELRQEVMFIDISVFGKSAETANKYLKKGSKALVEGRLEFQQWNDNQGNKRSKHIIVADTIQFMDSKQDKQDSYDDNYQDDEPHQGYNQAVKKQLKKDNAQVHHQQNQALNQNRQPKQAIQEIDIDDEDIPF